jgi:hypothetical protein
MTKGYSICLALDAIVLITRELSFRDAPKGVDLRCAIAHQGISGFLDVRVHHPFHRWVLPIPDLDPML